MSRRRPARLLAVAVALVMAAAACSEADLDLDSIGGGGGRRGLPDERTIDVDVPEDLELLALADVESFWTATFPDVFDEELDPVSGGFIPYGPDTEIPNCGQQVIDYDVAADNAFYCTFDDYIAWDDVGLLADVEDEYGPLAVGVIMAHEYGHAVQARVGSLEVATIISELQADCFAGAWADDVNGRIPFFTSDGGALEAAVAGFIELLRDIPGSDPRAPTAHGSAFDRVSAFQEGYDQGAAACATYVDEPPVITQMPFRTVEDQANQGNLPTIQLLELLPANIDAFYAALLEQIDRTWDPLDGIVLTDPDTDTVECGGNTLEGDELEYLSLYCPGDDTIYLDSAELIPDLEDIGDMAVGGEIARLYAANAQRQLGISAPDEDLSRHADCLTGVFISAMFTESIPIDDDRKLILSSGDFDEIVVVFLVFSEQSGDVSPVDRINDFRAGFLDGAAACDTYVD